MKNNLIDSLTKKKEKYFISRFELDSLVGDIFYKCYCIKKGEIILDKTLTERLQNKETIIEMILNGFLNGENFIDKINETFKQLPNYNETDLGNGVSVKYVKQDTKGKKTTLEEVKKEIELEVVDNKKHLFNKLLEDKETPKRGKK